MFLQARIIHLVPKKYPNCWRKTAVEPPFFPRFPMLSSLPDHRSTNQTPNNIGQTLSNQIFLLQKYSYIYKLMMWQVEPIR
jgi:hypothetical protein